MNAGQHTITAAEEAAGRANIETGIADVSTVLAQVLAAGTFVQKIVAVTWSRRAATPVSSANPRPACVLINIANSAVEGGDSLATGDVVRWIAA